MATVASQAQDSNYMVSESDGWHLALAAPEPIFFTHGHSGLSRFSHQWPQWPARLKTARKRRMAPRPWKASPRLSRFSHQWPQWPGRLRTAIIWFPTATDGTSLEKPRRAWADFPTYGHSGLSRFSHQWPQWPARPSNYMVSESDGWHLALETPRRAWADFPTNGHYQWPQWPARPRTVHQWPQWPARPRTAIIWFPKAPTSSHSCVTSLLLLLFLPMSFCYLPCSQFESSNTKSSCKTQKQSSWFHNNFKQAGYSFPRTKHTYRTDVWPSIALKLPPRFYHLPPSRCLPVSTARLWLAKPPQIAHRRTTMIPAEAERFREIFAVFFISDRVKNSL